MDGGARGGSQRWRRPAPWGATGPGRRWRVALALLVLVLLAAQPLAVLAQAPSEEGDEGSPWRGPRERELAAQTAHFDVWAPRGAPLAARGPDVAAAAEAVLPSVEARLATPLDDRVSLVLLPPDAAPPPCPARAAALPQRRRVILFDWPETREPTALAAFLAHELGHQLTYDRWGTLGPDPRLNEGIATWAAEPYWLAWQGWSSLDAAVANFQRAGAFEPLALPREGCLPAAERNVYYSAWASFVDYLQRRFGWDAVGTALTSTGADDRADYPAAFGYSLDELSAAWERTLRGE